MRLEKKLKWAEDILTLSVGTATSKVGTMVLTTQRSDKKNSSDAWLARLLELTLSPNV